MTCETINSTNNKSSDNSWSWYNRSNK